VGVCGAHQAGPKLANQIKRLGYYWPTMVQDAIKFHAKLVKYMEILYTSYHSFFIQAFYHGPSMHGRSM